MIRLVLLLCACMYVTLMVLGQDHGQKRYGLMMAEAQQTKAVPAAKPQAQPVVFIPPSPPSSPSWPRH